MTTVIPTDIINTNDDSLVAHHDSLVEAKLALANLPGDGYALRYTASPFSVLADGEATDADGYQLLVETGDAWRLEGFIGRTAMDLIGAGEIMLGESQHRDAYNNMVPSRLDIEPGWPGSAEFVRAHREEEALR